MGSGSPPHTAETRYVAAIGNTNATSVGLLLSAVVWV